MAQGLFGVRGVSLSFNSRRQRSSSSAVEPGSKGNGAGHKWPAPLTSQERRRGGRALRTRRDERAAGYWLSTLASMTL
jgi:hypothetical protein